MILGRDAFVGALSLAKPALADKSPLPALTYFWFDGKSVLAYNDVLGVVAPAKTDFTGGLEGSLLLGLLEHSSGEISLGVENGSAALGVSGAKAKLPVLPWESHVWDAPAIPDTANLIEFGTDFAAALAGVLVSAGAGGQGAPPAGVTLAKEGDKIALYAADGRSLSWARLAVKDVGDFGHVVLPAPFCEQVVKLQSGVLSWWADGAAVDTENVQVFSRLVVVEKLPDYRAAVDRYLHPGANATVVPVPPRLTPALDRVLVLLGDRPDLMDVDVDGRILQVSLKVPAGQLKEEVPLDKDHWAAMRAIKFDPALVRQCLGRAEQFLISPGCLVLLGSGDSGCLIASVPKA